MARPKVSAATQASAEAAGRAGRPSIMAVARQAGVSIATVSRVVNQRGSVQPDLARRVREAVAEIGYLPDGSARALSSGKSRLFGVIISKLTNPFFPELLQSFEECAVALGYEVLVASTDYDLQRMGTCIDRMLQRKVDGVAVMTFGIEGPLLSRFADQGVPLVFMDSAAKGGNMAAICVDYDAGIRQAVEHLVQLGHRRIGVVAGPMQQQSVALRVEAMHRAIAAEGLDQSPELLYRGDHSLSSGEAALGAFMALAAPPTAVLCSNDVSAIGVMHAAESLRLSIPADLSIVGFDGIEIGGYMVPPLTSVMMSRREIAAAAVETLWSRIEGTPREPAVVETRLFVRRTTAPPRL